MWRIRSQPSLENSKRIRSIRNARGYRRNKNCSRRLKKPSKTNLRSKRLAILQEKVKKLFLQMLLTVQSV